jgi:DNA-binding NarL/FixJ family response regulator
MLKEKEIFSEIEWNELVEGLSLTPRQAQICKNLFRGLSDKQIANLLQISVPTVRTHLSRLFSKFDAQDRQELILTFLQHFREGCRPEICPRWQ